MKTSKKIIAIILACLMLSLVLAACANDTTTPPPAGGNENAGTNDGTTTGNDPAPPPPPSADDVVLTYYGFSEWTTSEPFYAAYQEAVAKFESENPGYKIEIQADPWGDWEQKYRTMFAAGNPADIFIVNNPDFPTFANGGFLLNMDSYAEPGFFNKFFPGVQAMYNWQGNNMGMAFTTDCRVLWINKDVFSEAGLDPESPPTTWAELVSFANTISDSTGTHGFGMDLGLMEFPSQALFNASTGEVIRVANDGAITPNVDTPEFRGYLQTLLDLKPTFQPDFAIMNHHDVAVQFVEGQFGIIIGNTLSETDADTKPHLVQALIPRMNAGAPNGSFGGGFGISVSATTAAPEQAVKFAAILTDALFNARLHSDIPASEEGLAQSPLSTDPQFTVNLEQIKYARQAQPKTLYYAEIDSAVHETVVEVLVGGKTIDQAVTDLTSRINTIIGS